MIKQTRLDAPDVLAQNAQSWGAEFAQRRAENGAYRFRWKMVGAQSVRDIILPILKEITRNHCSFCDGFPMGATSRDTIEHFRPKSQFPYLSYDWSNLFLCCDVCQSAKLERFDERLLKPDEMDYEFEKYFENDYLTGELKSNPKASLEEQEKAQTTIEFYGLNNSERMRARVAEKKNYMRLQEDDSYHIDDFSYRFFI